MSRSQMPASNKSQQSNFLLRSPVGFFLGTIEKDVLVSLQWWAHPPSIYEQETELAHFIKQSLASYFTMKRDRWDFTFLLPGTPEEKQVYISLLKIPYGSTLTYGELAKIVNKPRAARWIGHVLSKNPLPIVIPCHRVVRKDRIGEYSAGGSSTKAWLLQWEKQQASPGYTPPS